MNSANYTVAANPASYRPQMTNHFEMTIQGLEGMINQADPDKGPITDSVLTIKIANDTFKEPDLNQQAVGFSRGNTTFEFPGRMDANQTTATFHCMVDKNAYDILYSWKLASGNPETGDVGDPQDYMKTVIIDETSGNKAKLLSSWTLNYAWISSLSGAQFSNSANEIKNVQITLRFFKPQYRKYKAQQ